MMPLSSTASKALPGSTVKTVVRSSMSLKMGRLLLTHWSRVKKAIDSLPKTRMMPSVVKIESKPQANRPA